MSESLEPSGSRRRRAATLCYVAVLFALNGWIAWRLFHLDYSVHMGSVGGAFVSLARYLRDHWRESGWWSIWFCGMPFEYTYPPLLHATVAAVSAVTGIEIGRAYHLVLGLIYAVSPVTVFLLARRLTGRGGVAFAAGLAYSLISPSALLFPAIRQDVGGPFHARRLQAMLMYGDSPHALALALIPIVLLLTDRACARRTGAAFAAAAIGAAAVLLTNIPGSIALGMALCAYCAAYGCVVLVAGICAGGYLLAAWWNPPAALLHTFSNTQWMEPASRLDGRRLVLLVACAAVVTLVAWLLWKLSVPRPAAFACLFALVAALVVCGNAWFGVTLIAQPMRFHLALEMALTLVATFLAAYYLPLSRKASAVAIVAGLAAVSFQVRNYRHSARELIRPLDIHQTSEYKVASWLEAHAGGRRVLVPGSIAFWLNTFTDTPQVTGCCDQSVLARPIKMAYYLIGSDDGAGERAAGVSIAWLKALGARFVVLSGPGSTEAFHDIAHPRKFEGKLRDVWRDGGDVIYEVPQPHDSLIHVLSPDEVVRTPPENGVKVEVLSPYIAAIEDPARTTPEVRWLSPAHARVRAVLEPDEVLSAQVAWHPGWQATVNGVPRPASSDGLGFIVIEPRCAGECTVDLAFRGAP